MNKRGPGNLDKRAMCFMIKLWPRLIFVGLVILAVAGCFVPTANDFVITLSEHSPVLIWAVLSVPYCWIAALLIVPAFRRSKNMLLWTFGVALVLTALLMIGGGYVATTSSRSGQVTGAALDTTKLRLLMLIVWVFILGTGELLFVSLIGHNRKHFPKVSEAMRRSIMRYGWNALTGLKSTLRMTNELYMLDAWLAILIFFVGTQPDMRPYYIPALIYTGIVVFGLIVPIRNMHWLRRGAVVHDEAQAVTESKLNMAE